MAARLRRVVLQVWSGGTPRQSEAATVQNRLSLAPKRLRDLRDWDSELPDSGVIDQAATGGLEIHRLRHSHVRQRISGRRRQGKAPMKGVAGRFAARGSHDVVRRGLVMVRIQFPDSPGAMLFGPVAESEILLEAQCRAFPMAPCSGRHLALRTGDAVFHHALGCRATREERHRIEQRLFPRER